MDTPTNLPTRLVAAIVLFAGLAVPVASASAAPTDLPGVGGAQSVAASHTYGASLRGCHAWRCPV